MRKTLTVFILYALLVSPQNATAFEFTFFKFENLSSILEQSAVVTHRSLTAAVNEGANLIPSFVCKTISFFGIDLCSPKTPTLSVEPPQSLDVPVSNMEDTAEVPHRIETFPSPSGENTPQTNTYITNEYITNPVTIIREVVRETVRDGTNETTVDTSEFITRAFFEKQTDATQDSIGSSNDNVSEDLSESLETSALIVSGNATVSGTLDVIGEATFTGGITATAPTTLSSLIVTSATATSLAATSFLIGSDVITDITGTGLSVMNGALSVSGGGGSSNWAIGTGALRPSTTLGISVGASSTIGDGTGTGGLTVAGTATTTNLKVTALTASRALFTAADGLFTTSAQSQYLRDALTDETGTGSVVFSDSPTFTGIVTFANAFSLGSTTLTNLSVTNSTTTNATVNTLTVNALRDGTNALGTNGMVLQTTGSGTRWVATSTLGLTTPTDGMSNWLFNGSRLSPSTTVGIGIFASSTIGNGTATGGLTISGGATTTGNAYVGGRLLVGTQSNYTTQAVINGVSVSLPMGPAIILIMPSPTPSKSIVTSSLQMDSRKYFQLPMLNHRQLPIIITMMICTPSIGHGLRSLVLTGTG